MALAKILESSKKIRFQDCDPFNHLNNGRYVDYYLNSREDQLFDNYNIDVFQIVQNEGLGWVICNNQVAYIRPVFTMEEIVFESQLISYAPKHLLVEMRMWNKDKTILKSVAWFGYVPFNLKKNRVVRHDEKYMELFKEVLLPIEEKTFEERELFFRQKSRKNG